MRLLLFNPEHDLALAANDPHYTPPASARQMAADLQDFPLWWAEEGDVLLKTNVDSIPKGKILPWGWNPLLVHQLRKVGVPDEALPSTSQLEAYRACSSREFGVKLLRVLREQMADEPLLTGESTWCTSPEEVGRVHERYASHSMMKAPWSGSGRGVRPVAHALTEKDWAWVQRTLERQGGVEVEPLYNKVEDFAMEFWAEGGRVRYEGLSLFSTTEGGVYRGNLVASEAEKERRLSARVPLSLLHDLRYRLEALLSSAGLPAWYTGPLGIDMMIVGFQDSGFRFQDSSFRFQVHPLVEMNLRMTMGWVALQMQRKLQENETATFVFAKKDGHYRATLTKND